jgi:hypothetical protein
VPLPERAQLTLSNDPTELVLKLTSPVGAGESVVPLVAATVQVVGAPTASGEGEHDRAKIVPVPVTDRSNSPELLEWSASPP